MRVWLVEAVSTATDSKCMFGLSRRSAQPQTQSQMVSSSSSLLATNFIIQKYKFTLGTQGMHQENDQNEMKKKEKKKPCSIISFRSKTRCRLILLKFICLQKLISVTVQIGVEGGGGGGVGGGGTRLFTVSRPTSKFCSRQSYTFFSIKKVIFFLITATTKRKKLPAYYPPSLSLYLSLSLLETLNQPCVCVCVCVLRELYSVR